MLHVPDHCIHRMMLEYSDPFSLYAAALVCKNMSEVYHQSIILHRYSAEGAPPGRDACTHRPSATAAAATATAAATGKGDCDDTQATQPAPVSPAAAVRRLGRQYSGAALLHGLVPFRHALPRDAGVRITCVRQAGPFLVVGTSRELLVFRTCFQVGECYRVGAGYRVPWR